MKLLIFDSNSILNRAFYGMPPLTTAAGQPTNAVYGFLNIILKLIGDENPDLVAAAFDMREKTFRHEMYDGYKAQRKGMPEDLASQLPYAKRLLDGMNIPRLEYPGFEGDDIIGTLAAKFSSTGIECVIATGDRDSLQLVNAYTRVTLAVSKAHGSESVICDVAAVREKYGVEPDRLIDVKAVMGDASDNIPGIAGLGEKSALALIKEFGSLDGIYENLDSPLIKPAQRQKLIDGKESAYMSRELARIKTDMDIPADAQLYQRRSYNACALSALLKELEFDAAVTRMGLDRQEPDEISVEAVGIDCADLAAKIGQDARIAFYPDGDELYIFHDKALYRILPDKTFLESVFSNESIRKTTFDAKPFIIKLMKLGIEMRGLDFDLMIAAYILNPSSSSYRIDAIVREHLSVAVAAGPTGCAFFLDVADKMSEKIEQQGMSALLREIEMPLIEVLAQMEYDGFCLDKEQLMKFGRDLTSRIGELTSTIYMMAGKQFNINSTKQLGEVLFVELGLPSFSKTKTGFSTGADVLEKLRGYHDIVDAILEYRRLTKLNSTYVEGLVNLIDSEGRIHSVFNQTVTQTGRISSSEPNLQNIPVRKPMGRQLRKMFTAREGWTLVDADYSQIELRVLASISGDEKMISAFRNGIDIHTQTASEVFKMPLDLVTPDMRSRAKAVNFGIVYGISDFSLAADVKTTRKEARSYIDNYFDTYRGIRVYLDDVVMKAREFGFVTTMFGRRRYIPELSVQNRNIRAFGERVAMNTPIQGSAADILKIAMVRVHERLRAEKLKAHIILQVHDELIVECPQQETDAVRRALCEEMERAADLKAPLKVDVGDGHSWYDAKE